MTPFHALLILSAALLLSACGADLACTPSTSCSTDTSFLACRDGAEVSVECAAGTRCMVAFGAWDQRGGLESSLSCGNVGYPVQP
jgi:hypothetical protein